MIAQFVKDLVHLEDRHDGLDQDGGLDGADGQAEFVLGVDENLVPQARFQMVLHLGQVVVGAGAALDQRPGVVEEVQAEVEQAANHRLAVDPDEIVRQVPAAGADDQDGRRVAQLVMLARVGVVECDVAPGRVAHVDVAAHVVVPGGRVRILEVRHEHLGAGVERVDDHLAFHRAGDLNAAVLQVGGDRGDLPVAVADVFGLLQEVGQPAAVELFLDLLAARHQLVAAGAEGALQLGDKGERVGGEDFVVAGLEFAADFHAFRQGQFGHVGLPGIGVFLWF